YVLRNSTPSRFRISAIASTTFMVAPFGEGGSAPLSTRLRTRGAVHSCPCLDAFGVCAGRAWPRPSSTPPASSRGGHCRPRLAACGVLAGRASRPRLDAPGVTRGVQVRRPLNSPVSPRDVRLRFSIDSPAVPDEELGALGTGPESQGLTAELLGHDVPAERRMVRGAMNIAMAALDRLRLQHGPRAAPLEQPVDGPDTEPRDEGLVAPIASPARPGERLAS